MDRESVRLVVRTTVLLLGRISKRTRTVADDLMASILQVNEDRLVDAVFQLSAGTNQPPSDEQIVAALQAVGIKV